MGGRREPEVHFPGADGADHLDQAAARGAADEAVVHHDDLLALDDPAHRVELDLDLGHPERLRRVDEGAAHVVVPDQAVLQLDAGRLAEAERHGVAAVGHGEDDVGARGGVLQRQPPAGLAPDPVHRLAEDGAVGPREVDQLEDAAADGARPERLEVLDDAVGDAHELAGLQLADEGGADQVERAGLARGHDALPDAAEHERPEAAGVHHRVQRAADADDEAVGPLHPLQRRPDLHLGVGRLGARDQVDQHLGVARRGEDGAPLDQRLLDFRGVGQVAVVRHAEGPGAVIDQAGLGVGQDGASGGRIPGVPDGHVARKLLELRVIEGLRHQAHPDPDARLAVRRHGHDPGALLPPVLQGVEAEVGHAGRVGDAGHSDDSAHGLGLRSVADDLAHPARDRVVVHGTEPVDRPPMDTVRQHDVQAAAGGANLARQVPPQAVPREQRLEARQRRRRHAQDDPAVVFTVERLDRREVGRVMAKVHDGPETPLGVRPADGRLGERHREAALGAVVGGPEEASRGRRHEEPLEPGLVLEVHLRRFAADEIAQLRPVGGSAERALAVPPTITIRSPVARK